MSIRDTRVVNTTTVSVDGNASECQQVSLRRVVVLTADEIPMPDTMQEKYGHQDTFKPVTLRLLYTELENWRTGEVEFLLNTAYVSGPNYKKDGTTGKREVEIDYWTHNGRFSDDTPEWVQVQAVMHDPMGPVNPFSLEAKGA